MRTRGSRRRRISSGIGAVAVTALLLTACSGNDGASGGADGDGPSSTAATEDAPTTTTTAAPLARYAGHRSEIYSDPANWLCRPDVTDDVCDSDLDATVVAADGTLTSEPWSADPDAPIDCFYVYPTISRDPAPYSDLEASPDQEGFAAVNQVARLGQECRVFAPVYRQRTLAGLVNALGGGNQGGSGDGASTGQPPASDPPPTDTSYPDVLDAWRQYMAHDNQGRGVVLVGHSQGAAMLQRLLEEEIDPDEDVRKQLVSAVLAGWAVRVPDGADVGGDFAQIPLCRAQDQTGCVVTWASFRSTAPPPAGSLFGRVRGGAEGVAACNSPASLAGGAEDAHPYFPSAPGASILSALGTDGGAATTWVDPAHGTIDTPYVTTPGLVRVECVRRDGADYLEVTVQADPADPRTDDIGGDLSPEWGLHLQDVNLVMGDLVELVHAQSGAWRDARG